MAQTTANLVGSVLMETPEAIITSEEAAGTDSEDRQQHSEPIKSKQGWKAKAKKLHRMVEQIDNEPIGIVVFKWCLIIVGTVMLGVVLFLTGEVIYDWSVKPATIAADGNVTDTASTQSSTTSTTITS